MLTEVCGEVLMPKLVSVMINDGIYEGDLTTICIVGASMVGAALLMMLGGLGGNFFAVKASVSFAADLRYDVFSKVQNFSFKNVDRFSTGSLVTRLTNDITQIQNVIRMGLVMLLRSPGMLIGGFFMALSMNSRLALVIIGIVPPLLLVLTLIIKKAMPRFDNMQKKLDNLNSVVQENITNVRVVKSFLRNAFEISKFKNATVGLKKATLRAMNVVICTNPVMTLAMNITTIAVVWLGGTFIRNSSMDIGNLTAFTTYIVQILMSLNMLSMIFLQLSRAAASMNRIEEVLDTEIDITDENAKYKNLEVSYGSIEFKNVYFKYHTENDEYVLKNINLYIKAGETVGIIGTTGCGKTSLVQLIPRLYDVNKGQVLVDGIDIRDYCIKNLRSAISMVLQKNVLFSGTIEENIKWGKEDATFEEIQSVAQDAQADKFVCGFTDGYNTELGQGGVNLSGGQKQRLCIVRALISNPKILILDDSTSAVDTATEKKIRECFKTTLKQTTKIIIAQRIQSVIEADKIVVLNDGEISGIGTHDELILSNEEYKSIYYSQMDKEVQE